MSSTTGCPATWSPAGSHSPVSSKLEGACARLNSRIAVVFGHHLGDAAHAAGDAAAAEQLPEQAHARMLPAGHVPPDEDREGDGERRHGVQPGTQAERTTGDQSIGSRRKPCHASNCVESR